MLAVTGAPVWKTVVGGSRSYVERAVKHLSAVESSRPVRSVRRTARGVEIRDDADTLRTFDHAVVATHADQALQLLADPTGAERALLGAFAYSRNETLLHVDAALLPARRGARASWNYLLPTCSGRDRVTITYDMNRLQRLNSPTSHFVTLNAAERVDPRNVLARMVYEHPVYTLASVAAQARLPELNTARVVFAGAYHGWGFHEDGCASGARAALALGVPW
jgi:predicted NAD/FAD-binding protein